MVEVKLLNDGAFIVMALNLKQKLALPHLRAFSSANGHMSKWLHLLALRVTHLDLLTVMIRVRHGEQTLPPLVIVYG